MRLSDYTRSRRILLSFRVTPMTAERLRQAATRDERTVAGFLRKLVERAVE